MAQNGETPPTLQDLAIPGFQAGASAAGLKTTGELDVCVLTSERPCVAAGVFTRNRVIGEPVRLDRRHLRHATHRAIVANSKYANVCTGAPGARDALAMARRVARLAGCDPREVFVASTGIIGQPIPMDRLIPGIDAAWAARGETGWTDAAHAIMTTDTRPKLARRVVDVAGAAVTLGGIAKGSGMIHPNMATMLSFIATDAAIDKTLLQEMLRRVADKSFNCVTIDGDTSTSDTVLVLANGAAANPPIAPGSPEAAAFEQALESLSAELARKIARDGEGAQHLIEIRVTGARSDKAARQIAHTVATSPLVKTAIAGRDANWGRIAAAAGRAGVPFSQARLTLRLNNFLIFENGGPVAFDESALTATLAREEIAIEISIGSESGAATVWTCDLTHDYISINADYRT